MAKGKGRRFGTLLLGSAIIMGGALPVLAQPANKEGAAAPANKAAQQSAEKPASAPHQFASSWASADYLQARLVEGQNKLQDEGALYAALDVRLAPEWHAYWRMPGQGGLPPHFDWSASKNLKEVSVEWPLPNRFKLDDWYTFGYSGHMMLPLRVVPEDVSKPVSLNLSADIMACHDICVPQKVKLSLILPPEQPVAPPEGQVIARVMDKIPQKENRPDLKIENMVIGPKAIVVNTFAQHGYETADMYVEAGSLYVTAKPEVMLNDKDPRKAMVRIAAPDGIDDLAKALMNQDVTLTFTDGQNAIERHFDF